ncbi:hypothetical protein NQ318_019451 [Aromia moschata]|uniref:Uncharacterized protein n=1 Tax=Aromia moschata TaxID=1265417 RepID=A0AAV8XB44_9CUCU|nr:hypothetical protein NQ318_019451 [Aromia moschata]
MQTEHPEFLNKILFTDEDTFTRRGVFNWRDNDLCNCENPHARHFQHEFKENIWCGNQVIQYIRRCISLLLSFSNHTLKYDVGPMFRYENTRTSNATSCTSVNVRMSYMKDQEVEATK